MKKTSSTDFRNQPLKEGKMQGDSSAAKHGKESQKDMSTKALSWKEEIFMVGL